MKDVTIDLNTDDAMIGSGGPIKSKKKKTYILPIVILAIIALLVVFIKLDIGKISSKYIEPKIKNIPIVKNILPKSKEKDLYDGYSKEQMIDLLSGSELQLQEAESLLEEQLNQKRDLEKKIEALEVFEEEYVRIKEEKKIFDEQVATMDQIEFAKFYEKMYPENAKEVYSEIIQVQQMTKEQRKYASLISEMDETRAAKVLENLFQTDMDIILSILSNMDTESASAILAEMDSKIASMIVKQLSPQ